jgi:hypothetical protein
MHLVRAFRALPGGVAPHEMPAALSIQEGGGVGLMVRGVLVADQHVVGDAEQPRDLLGVNMHLVRAFRALPGGVAPHEMPAALSMAGHRVGIV